MERKVRLLLLLQTVETPKKAAAPQAPSRPVGGLSSRGCAKDAGRLALCYDGAMGERQRPRAVQETPVTDAEKIRSKLTSSRPDARASS